MITDLEYPLRPAFSLLTKILDEHTPLLASLQKRLHASTAHLNALADIYKQRAAIEAAYADGLHKLARTAEQGGLTGKAGNDWPRGSGEDRLWDSVLSELAEVRPAPSSCACN